MPLPLASLARRPPAPLARVRASAGSRPAGVCGRPGRRGTEGVALFKPAPIRSSSAMPSRRACSVSSVSSRSGVGIQSNGHPSNTNIGTMNGAGSSHGRPRGWRASSRCRRLRREMAVAPHLFGRKRHVMRPSALEIVAGGFALTPRHRRIALSLFAGTRNSAAPLSIAVGSSGASMTPRKRTLAAILKTFQVIGFSGSGFLAMPQYRPRGYARSSR
jgi:hypothetical protein